MEPNSKQIAENCKNFAEFHKKMEILRKLYRDFEPQHPVTDNFTKQAQVNLQFIARQSMTFSDFHERAKDVQT